MRGRSTGTSATSTRASSSSRRRGVPTTTRCTPGTPAGAGSSVHGLRFSTTGRSRSAPSTMPRAHISRSTQARPCASVSASKAWLRRGSQCSRSSDTGRRSRAADRATRACSNTTRLWAGGTPFLPGDDPTEVQAKPSLLVSTIALGYTRDFQASYLGPAYGSDRGYLRAEYFYAGKFLITVEGGVGALEHPNLYFNSSPGVAPILMADAYTDVRADATLFTEYRIIQSIGINATFQYSENFSSTQLPVTSDDLVRVGNYSLFDQSWRRFQAFFGVRWLCKRRGGRERSDHRASVGRCARSFTELARPPRDRLEGPHGVFPLACRVFRRDDGCLHELSSTPPATFLPRWPAPSSA